MWFLAGLGALIAGIALVAGPLPGVLKAMNSGVIVGKGHGSPRIERASEPERFEKLLRARMASLGPGLLVILGAAAWLALNLVGVWQMQHSAGG